MTAMYRISRRIFLALTLLTAGLAQAQLSIEITGAGANRIPVTTLRLPVKLTGRLPDLTLLTGVR